MRRLVLALVLAMWVAPTADAQPGGGPAANAQKRRERIKNRIRALRAEKLVEELGEQTTAKMLPILAKYDDEFDKLLQARAEIEKKLAAAAEQSDGKAIDRVIDDAVANQRAFWETEDRRLAEMRKTLTPAQVAKLLVVLPPLERRIQNQLRNAIQRAQNQQQQQQRRGAKAAVDVDDDDDDDAPAPAPPPPARPRAQKGAPPGMTAPCDPYSAQHGCK